MIPCLLIVRVAPLRHEVKTPRRRLGPRTLSASRLAPASAQLVAPNAAGVSIGHVHVNASDVDAQVRFWTAVGGKVVQREKLTMVQFPGIYVLLGTGLQRRHRRFDGQPLRLLCQGFRRDVAKWKAAGLTWERANIRRSGKGSSTGPDSLRIEIYENKRSRRRCRCTTFT